jgi:hypothetical protein
MFGRRRFMLLRVLTSTAPKEKLDSINKRLKSSLTSAQKQKGYKGELFGVNPETGEQIMIGIWDTEEDMLASAKAPHTLENLKQAKADGVNFLSTKVYTVIIKD